MKMQSGDRSNHQLDNQAMVAGNLVSSPEWPAKFLKVLGMRSSREELAALCAAARSSTPR